MKEYLMLRPLKVAIYASLFSHNNPCRARWSSGYHTRLWIRGSRVRSRPRSMDFFQSVKILNKTSFGREVKSRVVDLRHVKETQAEIRASQQNLSDFTRSMSEATLMT